MPKFTLEHTYLVPHYRHRTVETATLAEAMAIVEADNDWDDQHTDYDASGPEYFTGAWKGSRPYAGPNILPKDTK